MSYTIVLTRNLLSVYLLDCCSIKNIGLASRQRENFYNDFKGWPTHFFQLNDIQSAAYDYSVLSISIQSVDARIVI